MPAIVAHAATATVVTSTWGTPTNATGSTTGNYATWAVTTANGTGQLDLTAFDLSSLPSNAVITNVELMVRSHVTNTTRQLAPQWQWFHNGNTAWGALQTGTHTTTSTNEDIVTFDGSTTSAAQLKAGVKLAFTARRSGATQAAQTNLDLARITVNYTLPAPNPPTNLTATNVTGAINLAWNAPTSGETVASYTVGRTAYPTTILSTNNAHFDTGLGDWAAITNSTLAWTNQAMQITSASTTIATAGINQFIPIGAGEQYRFSGHVKNISGARATRLRLDFYDSNFTDLVNPWFSSYVTPTSTPTSVSLVHAPRSTAAYIKASIEADTGTMAAGDVHEWDDFTLARNTFVTWTNVGNVLSYSDTDLVDQYSYDYKVRSVSTEGIQSADSNVVTLKYYSSPPIAKSGNDTFSLSLAESSTNVAETNPYFGSLGSATGSGALSITTDSEISAGMLVVARLTGRGGTGIVRPDDLAGLTWTHLPNQSQSNINAALSIGVAQSTIPAGTAITLPTTSATIIVSIDAFIGYSELIETPTTFVGTWTTPRTFNITTTQPDLLIGTGSASGLVTITQDFNAFETGSMTQGGTGNTTYVTQLGGWLTSGSAGTFSHTITGANTAGGYYGVGFTKPATGTREIVAADACGISVAEIFEFPIFSIVGTDSSSLSTAETFVLAGAYNEVPASDAITLSVTDTSIRTITYSEISSTETYVLSTSESTAFATVNVSSTDSTSLSLVEAYSSNAVMSSSDTFGVSLTEAFVFAGIPVSNSDAITLGMSENSSFGQGAQSASETVTLSVAETSAFGVVLVSGSDATTLSVSDGSSFSVMPIATSDNVMIGVTDGAGFNQQPISSSDTLSISAAEAATASNSQIFDPKTYIRVIVA